MTAERYITQSDIENEIVRIGDLLEQATANLATDLETWANAEADYKIAFAHAYRACPDKTPEHLRRQIATEETKDDLRASLMGEAVKVAMQEKCRQLRAQLDAVRTLSANVRSQT